MNGRITEHIFYSLAPELTSQTAQSVRKARSCFLPVPRLNPERPYFGFLPEIPQPHHRIQTQTQRRRSFRALALVRLRFLAAQKLFGVFERVFDRPSVVVAFQNLCGRHRQIGGKKKIVPFFAARVSADDKQYRLMRNPIPYDLTGIHQSLDLFASLTKFDLLPISNIRSHFLWVGKTFAFLARSASGFLSSFWRKIENLCIALDSRNQMCLRLQIKNIAGTFLRTIHSKLKMK